MKVLIAISDSFCANFIKGQGKFLKEQGHDVVIVSGPGEEIDNLEKNESVRVIRIPFSREISIFNDLKSLYSVVKLVYKEKPDIINAGNPKTGFLFSLGHLFYWKTPLIFTLRGIRSDTLKGTKRRIVKITEKITALFANKVIAISPSLKEHAIYTRMVSSSKVIVLSKGSSNGIDVDKYTINNSILEQSHRVLKSYNISEGSFKLLYVGRVTKDKGITEVLDALRICWNQGADIQFLIAGPIEKDDPIPDSYYKMIDSHPNIIYLGKQIDVRPIYALGNALVLFSHREGFGNVVIEASSMKLPTIVANIPGLKDTTESEQTGILVEGKNSIKLSEAILKLYNDRKLASQMGENGRVRIENYFRNEIVWSKQLELYNQLCR